MLANSLNQTIGHAGYVIVDYGFSRLWQLSKLTTPAPGDHVDPGEGGEHGADARFKACLRVEAL